MASTPSVRMTVPRLLFFGLPDYAVQLASIPVSLYIAFVYTKDYGLDLSLVGLVIMATRLTDVVTDPLIGWLSDRTETPFGKRKPWMAAGALVMAFSCFMLFAPPWAPDIWHLLIWLSLLWLGWTMIYIPYWAWGAELTDDYDERSRITGWRQLFGFLGSISVMVVPTASVFFFGYGGLPREGMTIVGGMALVLVPLLVALALWRVPERHVANRAQPNLLKAAGQMLRNGTFLLLFTSFLLLHTGIRWSASLFIMLASFVVLVEDKSQQILIAYYTANAIGLPLWLYLSYRIGKKHTWMSGAALFVLIAPLFLLLGPGDLWGFVAILLAYGLAGGNFVAISLSMKADVIDIAANRTGEHVAGSYMAAWSLGQKFFEALASGGAPLVAASFGFDPTGSNGPDELLALRLTMIIPCWCMFVAALLVMTRYPLSAERLMRVRAALLRRQVRRS